MVVIPEGEWHCPPCSHAALVLKLRQALRTFEAHAKRRDNQELRKKRLAYVGISLANVLPASKRHIPSSQGSSSSSEEEQASSDDDDGSSDEEPVYQLRQRRAANNLTYRFNEYDDLINSAIQVNISLLQFIFCNKLDVDDGDKQKIIDNTLWGCSIKASS